MLPFTKQISSDYGNNNPFPQPPYNDSTVYYVPSDGQCSSTTNVVFSGNDDDNVKVGQFTVTAIALAVVGNFFALISPFGWFQTSQKLNRMEMILKSTPQHGTDIELSENPMNAK